MSHICLYCKKRTIHKKEHNTKQAKSKDILSRIRKYLNGWICLNIKLVGYIPSFRLRQFIYTSVFNMKIGKGTKIRGFSDFYCPWNIRIGNNTMVGQNCILDGRNGLNIGNNVNISDYVSIFTMQHDVNSNSFEVTGGSVKIGDRAWLCFRSVILPNVTAGGISVQIKKHPKRANKLIAK